MKRLEYNFSSTQSLVSRYNVFVGTERLNNYVRNKAIYSIKSVRAVYIINKLLCVCIARKICYFLFSLSFIPFPFKANPSESKFWISISRCFPISEIFSCDNTIRFFRDKYL